jgi:predicted transcriptional regulator
MDDFFDETFCNLLNSISSSISHKILHLYAINDQGFNLTKTSQEIEEKISTTQDHINKLLTYELIYRVENDYFLSNFGEYLYNELRKLSSLDKFKTILGKIPKNSIPHEIIDEFIPYLKNCQINSSSWNFMNMMDENIEKMKLNLNEKTQYFEIIGWWSLEYDLEIMKSKFPNFNLTGSKLKGFFRNFHFKFVGHKPILKELKQYNLLDMIIRDDDFAEKFHIYDEIDRFNFCFFRFNDLLGIFLVKDDDIDFQNYIFIENNQGALKVFEKLFEYYWEDSKPLDQFI